jgi:hypothetical protein
MTSQTEQKPQAPRPLSRKKLVLFAICLAVVSAGMYVSIIIKTAVIGP